MSADDGWKMMNGILVANNYYNQVESSPTERLLAGRPASRPAGLSLHCCNAADTFAAPKSGRKSSRQARAIMQSIMGAVAAGYRISVRYATSLLPAGLLAG